MIVSNIKNSKIFITGGAGFIGSKLASILCENNQVVLFDNLHNNALENMDIKDNKNIKFIKGDILDLKSIEDALDDDVDYIIHCAAIAGVTTVINNPMLTLRVNIEGVINVFRAAEKLSSLKRFIDFSTSEVYGQMAYNVEEGSISPNVTVGEARWTYAISKLTGEFIAHANHVQNNVPTVTVRPFNVYGPNQVGVGAIHNFVKNAIKGDPICVHGDGTQIRSWCFVDDFVQGVLLALESEVAIGKSYNIGNPDSSVTNMQLAQMVKNISNSTSAIEKKAIDYKDVYIRIPKIDAAHNDLGYTPVVSLEEGLKRTIHWYTP